MSKAASTPATKDATTQIPDASDSDSDDDWLPGPGCIHDHPFAVVDPFPFLKLAADERRVVLSFLLGARSYPLGGRAPGAPERVRFSACAGFVSGVAAGACNNPFDVLKSRRRGVPIAGIF